MTVDSIDKFSGLLPMALLLAATVCCLPATTGGVAPSAARAKPSVAPLPPLSAPAGDVATMIFLHRHTAS